jgi:hypothetical protein
LQFLSQSDTLSRRKLIGANFFFQSVQLGAPPNWHGNLSGVNSIHWSQIGDFDSPDIKVNQAVGETNRISAYSS